MCSVCIFWIEVKNLKFSQKSSNIKLLKDILAVIFSLITSAVYMALDSRFQVWQCLQKISWWNFSWLIFGFESKDSIHKCKLYLSVLVEKWTVKRKNSNLCISTAIQLSSKLTCNRKWNFCDTTFFLDLLDHTCYLANLLRRMLISNSFFLVNMCNIQ